MSRKRRKPEMVREASAGYGVTEVSASELTNEWHRWLHRLADGGQTIVVTRYGKPIATLSPVEAERAPVEGWVGRQLALPGIFLL